MSPAAKSTKKVETKRVSPAPIFGKAERRGSGWAFSIELVSFTLDGEPMEQNTAANDLADLVVWAINHRCANANSKS